ncbi:MAG TPA: hypothetical protein VGG33_09675 [Polyangia bacterium]
MRSPVDAGPDEALSRNNDEEVASPVDVPETAPLPNEGGVEPEVAMPQDAPPTIGRDVTTVTFAWASVGDTAVSQDIVIDVAGGTIRLLGTEASESPSHLTTTERQELMTFLQSPGVLTAFTSVEACGKPWADYNEYVQVDTTERVGRRKEITFCEQAPFVELRSKWKALRDKHFCEGRPLHEPPFICVRGLPGAICDDTGPRPNCEAGHWKCPAVVNAPPLVPSNQCACTGIGCFDAGRD